MMVRQRSNARMYLTARKLLPTGAIRYGKPPLPWQQRYGSGRAYCRTGTATVSIVTRLYELAAADFRCVTAPFRQIR